MKRRKFIQLSGMGAVAVPTATMASKAAFAPVIPRRAPDVVVVGAGTFGLWTAYHLTKLGAQVVLLDSYGPGNSRASSGGETRLIQADNDNNLYVESAMRSYDWWKQLEEDSGETLVLSTGRLAMSSDKSYRELALKRKQQLEAAGINNTEILDADEIRYRWPQIYSDDIAVAMFNEGRASGSTLMARRGCRAIARQFQKEGGSLRTAKGIPVVRNGQVVGVDAGGEVLQAAHYVFACGPWLPKLFPGLLWPKLRIQRRDVLFIGTPSGDSRFSFPNLPEWSVSGSGYYGFPDIDGRGVKVAIYPDENSFDPDTDERLVNHYQVKRAYDFAGKRFPGLADQPVTESRVCQVTYSVDGNFIVDQHPSYHNVMIVGGGSGHGFKHGPAVGHFAANKTLGNASPGQLVNLFKLKEENFQD